MVSRNSIPMALILVAILMPIITQGCGGTDYTELRTSGPSSTSSGSTSGSGGTGFAPPPGPISSGPSSASMPPIAANFSVTGPGGVSPSYSIQVDTDSILNLKITAGPASQIAAGQYSNFSANYGCIRYNIAVLGQTTVTQTLAVPGAASFGCQGAPSSQTIDFSSRLTPGHGPVTITVTTNGYDFYCQNCMMYPWLYNAGLNCGLYCPLHPVYQSHTVTGTLSVQVNGTSPP